MGDEPYQIHSKFPTVTVAVDANRGNGIRILEERSSPDVILLDDAFQHRKVTYGLSILLTAYENLYSDDQYLPAGNLRDSKGQAKRANLIIVTKCPTFLSGQQQKEIIDKLRPAPHQKVLFSTLTYDSNIKGPVNAHKLDYFKDKKLTLVTGIANPEPLVTYFKEGGLAFEHLRFKDHHTFTENEVQRLRQKEYLITTEKDYVRLKGKVEKVYYLPVKHQFLDKGLMTLKENLVNFMKQDS